MKVKAYRVHQQGVRTLADVARWLDDRSLADRQFGGRYDIRLEDMRVGQRLLWLDFAHKRVGHGPGRMAPDQPIRDIDLADGEHFGEDTAAVIDMQTGYAAVQYNHHGPKVTAIEDYLRLVDIAIAGASIADGINPERFGFTWAMHLNPEGYERLRNLGIYREVMVQINVPGATQHDFIHDRALGQVIDHVVPEGTETVTLAFKAAAPRDSALGDQGVEGWLTDIRRLGDSVQKAIVKGRVAQREPIEEIDLIEEQLSRDVALRIARGERYAREDRWAALRATLELWTETDKLPVAG